MLGPNDIEDFYDDAERLRAQILAHPVAARLRAAAPGGASSTESELAARVRRFDQQPPLSAEQLGALLADLERFRARR